MKTILRSGAPFLVVLFMLRTPIQLDAAPKPTVPKKLVYIAVVSVDLAAMTITVEPRNSMSTEAKTYKVTTGTVIKVNGNPAAMADLKPEMQGRFTLAADGATASVLDGSPAPRGSE